VEKNHNRKSQGVFLCSKELGCPVNAAFTTQLHNYVIENNWTFRDVESADYLIIVTCCTLPEYRREVPATVRYLAHRYPKKRIIVTGCFVKKDMVAAPNVVYIRMSQRDGFDALFDPAIPLREASSCSAREDDSAVRALGDDKAASNWPYPVMASAGCVNHCAFCNVKNVFPTVQSVPLGEIVSACQEGVRKGYKNFSIGATDIASYGQDLGLDVTDLFSALFAKVLKGNPELAIGFHAFEPAGLIRHFAHLKKYFQTGRIGWIKLPIQSGSDAVLRSMHRRYRIKEVLRVVRELRRLAPDLKIDTDLLFCYPTETRKDFEASLKMIGYFDQCSLIVFGRHENTPAFVLKDVFSATEKARRCKIIKSLPTHKDEGPRPEYRQRAEIKLPSLHGTCRFSILSEGSAARARRTLRGAAAVSRPRSRP
jgi:tRNA A37 methylthiotransferase MiaB